MLFAAVLGTILVNGMVLRRRFEPLERVIAAMEDVTFGPGGDRPRLPAAGSAEVARLNSAFERMLDRLEAERSRTAGPSCAARRRSARASPATSTTRPTRR